MLDVEPEYCWVKDLERKNAYANIFGFLAGLTNSLSIIIMGIFTTHVTGAVTNAGRYLGNLNVSLFELYIGLFFFIIGSFFATILMAKKGFPVPILFTGALANRCWNPCAKHLVRRGKKLEENAIGLL